jgi:hypothetical protein
VIAGQPPPPSRQRPDGPDPFVIEQSRFQASGGVDLVLGRRY